MVETREDSAAGYLDEHEHDKGVGWGEAQVAVQVEVAPAEAPPALQGGDDAEAHEKAAGREGAREGEREEEEGRAEGREEPSAFLKEGRASSEPDEKKGIDCKLGVDHELEREALGQGQQRGRVGRLFLEGPQISVATHYPQHAERPHAFKASNALLANIHIEKLRERAAEGVSAQEINYVVASCLGVKHVETRQQRDRVDGGTAQDAVFIKLHLHARRRLPLSRSGIAALHDGNIEQCANHDQCKEEAANCKR